MAERFRGYWGNSGLKKKKKSEEEEPIEKNYLNSKQPLTDTEDSESFQLNNDPSSDNQGENNEEQEVNQLGKPPTPGKFTKIASKEVESKNDGDSLLPPRTKFTSKVFNTNGFNLKHARLLHVTKKGNYYFFYQVDRHNLQFITITFSNQFNRYDIETHQISMKNFKDYKYLQSVPKNGSNRSSGGLLLGVSQFKGIVILKLLEDKSYSVLVSMFKLSFDLAFLFIKGFVSRISLVFILYFSHRFLNKQWRKYQAKLNSWNNRRYDS